MQFYNKKWIRTKDLTEKMVLKLEQAIFSSDAKGYSNGRHRCLRIYGKDDSCLFLENRMLSYLKFKCKQI